MDDSNIIKIGPVGNKNGNPWEEKGRNKIVQIFISHDKNINSIQFQYVENGSLVLSARHGGQNDGNKFDVVKFKYPSEYITWISGYASTYSNLDLKSITFGTNHGEYGPFGNSNIAGETEFCFRLGEDNQFHGFHGTADNNCVKSIGVYLKPNTVFDSFQKNVKVMNEKGSWESVE